MASTDTPGVIEAGKLYTVAEARERLSVGDTTWAKFRALGLQIRKVGTKSYVLGDDVISVVTGDDQEGADCDP